MGRTLATANRERALVRFDVQAGVSDCQFDENRVLIRRRSRKPLTFGAVVHVASDMSVVRRASSCNRAKPVPHWLIRFPYGRQAMH
jgi:hypothetical protein